MGSEIILTKDNEDVVNIGRSDNYFYDELELDIKSAFDSIEKRLYKSRCMFMKDLVDYVTNKKGNRDLDDIIDDFEDSCIKAGRTFTLLNVLDDFDSLLKFRISY